MKKAFLITILISISLAAGFYFIFKPFEIKYLLSKPAIGEAVDSLHGVMVFYNGRIGNKHGRNTSSDGYNLGLKYQCVEFVKRYYYEYYNHKMPNPWGHAKDFFDSSVEDAYINSQRNLVQYTNGSKSKPHVGDLLVFDGTRLNPYGHVVIVSGVKAESIEIIQQNPGPNAPSRQDFELIIRDGYYYVSSNNVLGWLRMKQ